MNIYQLWHLGNIVKLGFAEAGLVADYREG